VVPLYIYVTPHFLPLIFFHNIAMDIFPQSETLGFFLNAIKKLLFTFQAVVNYEKLYAALRF
jgi:hypothetical protein